MAVWTSSTMYRTCTNSSGIAVDLLAWCSHRLDQKPEPSLQLGGGALERRQRLVVAAGLARRIGDAPMDQFRCPGELGTDLAHSVAQADHAVEATLRELVEV